MHTYTLGRWGTFSPNMQLKKRFRISITYHSHPGMLEIYHVTSEIIRARLVMYAML